MASSLSCDVCFEQFTGGARKPLVICPNGHSVCSLCSASMKLCPQCRSECLRQPITNITLLKILESLVSLKVLVLGEAGVGKSSLMLRFTEEKFTPDILPTVGIDFRVKVVEHRGYSVKLAIWDTAGQERFRNITAAYYRGAQAVVLVYDITNRRTFEKIGGWLQEEERHNGNKTVKLLVGNKSDRASRRKVTVQEGKDWADRFNMIFVETSAKDACCVEQAFLELVDRVLQSPGLWAPGQALGPPGPPATAPAIRLHGSGRARGDSGSRSPPCCGF